MSLAAAASGTRLRPIVRLPRSDRWRAAYDMHAKHEGNIRSACHRTADDGHGSAFPTHEHTRVGQHGICGFLRIDDGFTRFRIVECKTDACRFREREHDLRHGFVGYRLGVKSCDGFGDGDALFKRAMS